MQGGTSTKRGAKGGVGCVTTSDQYHAASAARGEGGRGWVSFYLFTPVRGQWGKGEWAGGWAGIMQAGTGCATTTQRCGRAE